MSATALRARRVGRNAKRPKRFAGGRRCAEPGCVTRLSAYNPKDTCYVHTVATIPRLRGRVIQSD